MTYFFITGRLKALCLFELESVCKVVLGSDFKIEDKNDYVVLKTNSSPDFVKDVFSRLGGFLKYGEIFNEGFDLKSLAQDEKVLFGVSAYGNKYTGSSVHKFSKKLKEEFIREGKKVRFVLPKEKSILTTAQVLKNNLLDDGFELVLLENSIGRTLQVQDFENFARREYSKPFVDREMGVLPVKLARMMVNCALVKKGGNIWDPFCGSGNILLEALDLGYDVLGTDIDNDSLEGASKNVDWLKKKFNIKQKSSFSYLDILNPTPSKLNYLSNIGIDGIVCEPYMGEAQRKPLEIHKANSLVKQHFSLVQSLFLILENIEIVENIRLVVVFPEYRTKKGWVSIDNDKLNFKNAKLIKKDLHWSRENSIIKRLIFVFEYKAK